MDINLFFPVKIPMFARCHRDHQGMTCEWSNHILTISSTCCLKKLHKLDSQSSLSFIFRCEVFFPVLASQLAGSFYTENRSLQLVKKRRKILVEREITLKAAQSRNKMMDNLLKDFFKIHILWKEGIASTEDLWELK